MIRNRLRPLGLFFLIISFAGCINSVPDTKSISEIEFLKDSIYYSQKAPFEVISGTFLGNNTRNYYGNHAPSKLQIIWQFCLGSGKTRVGKDTFTWSGAGWTGQPLLIKEDSVLYIIQGAYDHNLRKIDAKTGKEIWKYTYDDVIKGTGSIWINSKADSLKDKIYILQGSRMGLANNLNSDVVPSYRAISYFTGEEIWRYNSIKTRSYSRDVDGSALVINDMVYLGLENGRFISFVPNVLDSTGLIVQPKIFINHPLYSETDSKSHGGNLVTESSPSLLGSYIYIASGSGHVYGYNRLKDTIDWDFYIGSDIDGSAIVTSDSCLLISVEKQYIAGKGGIFKLNPRKKPEDAVVWYFPTENRNFATWEGGVIGSVGINDFYNTKKKYPDLAVFIGIDEYLYIVEHSKIDTSKKVLGPDNKTKYPSPSLVYKHKTGASISTPIVVDNRIIAATYDGIYLFEYDEKLQFKLLDYQNYGGHESTPVVYEKRVYIASRNGFLYCLGEKP